MKNPVYFGNAAEGGNKGGSNFFSGSFRIIFMELPICAPSVFGNTRLTEIA